MKVTQWFDDSEKPVRKGVYQKFSNSKNPQFSYWNGKYWGLISNSVNDAAKYHSSESYFQWGNWRGIAK